jgi:Ser/Thr protein kinase RdoA (MazF antagonist)
MTALPQIPSPEHLRAIADRFAHASPIADLKPFGSGNINDTFLVTLEGDTRIVLQRINTQVFRQPALVMQNMRRFTEHVHQRLQTDPPDRRWETPRVILTTNGQDHWCDEASSYWRAISFIEGSESFDTMHDQAHAREIGYALGMFHHLTSDLEPTQFADTLPGFHITPQYLAQYESVRAGATIKSAEVDYGLRFVADRAPFGAILEAAKAQGKLPLRLMHGDPKVNNVMFDCATQKAVGVVDLDTVKPGLVHYDIGDCLRSGCNPIGEETRDWQSVYFDPDLCEGILQGYLSVAKTFLTVQDYDYLFEATRLIAFELGLRFFTDYLAGNVYFKTQYPEHNLTRALVQFQLTASIESQESTLRRMIQDLQNAHRV